MEYNDKEKKEISNQEIFNQNEEILKNQKIIMTDIKYNRIIYSVCLIISLFYFHSQIEDLKDIISMLVQIFMS